MNKENILNIIENCRQELGDSNTQGAIDFLSKLQEYLPNGEKKNQCILLRSLLTSEVKKQITDVSSTDRNKILLQILQYLDHIEEYIINEKSIAELGEYNLFDTYKDILEKSKKSDELTKVESEELYLQTLRLRKEIFSGVDEKIKKEYPHILFNRIFFAHELETEEIKEITSIPTNSNFEWYEKSIIVSALVLSLIKEFNPDKVQLLINFISPFEEMVWQRALTGLAIGLHNKAHTLKLYPDLINQLNKLQEISVISKGLQIIAIELEHEHYNGCFRAWNEIIGEDSFRVLRNVDSWFIPFYPNNPILEKIKPKLPNIGDIELLPDLITNDRHLSNSQKYVLTLNLEHYQEAKIIRILSRLKRMSHCTREHIYDPYIADFYWFYKGFPALKLEDIFQKKINLYKSNLIELLIDKEKVNLFRGVIEFRSNNLPEALELLKDANISDKFIGLEIKEQGMLSYLTSDYHESIKTFEHVLTTQTKISEKGITYTNLSLLYILVEEKEKSLECITKAIEHREYKYSAKNLGYLDILNGDKLKALESFKKAITAFSSFDHFMFEVDNDYKHIVKVIDQEVLDEIIEKVKTKYHKI